MMISRNICVIDDDASVRKALDRLLKSVGYETEIFPSAESFLERPHFRGIDCLLLDIQLPGMSGIDLQKQLTSSGMNIPTLLMTAHGDPTMHEKAAKSGVANILRKPFDKAILLDAMDSIFQSKTRSSEFHGQAISPNDCDSQPRISDNP
ncbi:MAG: response regulator [Candidatus Abyssobacteria bacterium SURF_5]|uniref:Response regulator n=1 Tax=Abyssobacteria bacterium (strain SURF_5) TaxID=2093360 RepID=A0A3A4NSA9_ABYX5|nr:MAG: response regulator [Candidatus Abyssubacteria bacterium SURF_5]